jgi:hypothetical protein
MIAKSVMEIYLKDYLSIFHKDFSKKILFFPDSPNDISNNIINYHTISTECFDDLFSEKNEWCW